MGRDSGSVIGYVQGLDMTLSHYNPLGIGGSSYIKLPPKVASTKAVINMKNQDERCFKWAVMRALNMVDVHPERITPLLREQAEKLDWGAIKFPTEPGKCGIDQFERTNDVGICISGYEEKEYVPVRLPKECRRVADLFFFGDGSGKMHYGYVRDLFRLVGASVSKHKTETYLCRCCLCNQHTAKRLEEHERFFSKHEPTRTF